MVTIEMPFNTFTTEFFEGSDIEELIKHMFAHFKMQVENPWMPESGFALDEIMHLHISCLKWALTKGSSCADLQEWIVKKKAVINPKFNNIGCLERAVIAPLHQKEIDHHTERSSLLQHYEDQYIWWELEFPLAIKKNRFEKNNSNITENVQFKNGKHIDSKKSIYTHESELNSNCSEQVNVLMIPNWENRHYTTIKNISRLLSKLHGRNKHAYYFHMNCLSCFLLTAT